MTDLATSPELVEAPPRRRWLTPLWIALVAGLAIGALAVFVFPTSSFLDQRSALAESRAQLAALNDENAALEQRVVALRTDAEIERVARERYNLVRPGEQAYAVLPAVDPTDLPATWPFPALRKVIEVTTAAPVAGAPSTPAPELQGP